MNATDTDQVNIMIVRTVLIYLYIFDRKANRKLQYLPGKSNMDLLISPGHEMPKGST